MWGTLESWQYEMRGYVIKYTSLLVHGHVSLRMTGCTRFTNSNYVCGVCVLCVCVCVCAHARTHLLAFSPFKSLSQTSHQQAAFISE